MKCPDCKNDREGFKEPCPWCGEDSLNNPPSELQQKQAKLDVSNAFIYLFGGILAVIIGASISFFFWWIPIGLVCIAIGLKKILLD